MSNTYMGNENPSANQTPQDAAKPSTYEKIGVLDVSVYSNCDYPKKDKDGHNYLTGLWKGDRSHKLKLVLLVVCASVFAAVLAINFALGVTGVAKSCSPAADRCKTEERSTLFNDTSHTDSLTITTEVSKPI